MLDRFEGCGSAHLTCFPWIRARAQRLTMFHEVLFSYRIRFSAMATWEWQLSQQRLCFWGKSGVISIIEALKWQRVALVYHSVLVLLRGIVNGCIPGVGAAGIDFAYVEHPVPAITEANSRVWYWKLVTTTTKTHPSLTWLVFQKPCYLPERGKSFRAESVIASLEDLWHQQQILVQKIKTKTRLNSNVAQFCKWQWKWRMQEMRLHPVCQH